MKNIRPGDEQSADQAFLEMDLVTNTMAWGDEVYQIFGYTPNGFSPSRSDYLSSVHVKDRALVEQFFDKVIRTGEADQLEHRIVIHGHQVKRLSVRARIKYDERKNKLVLLGTVQELGERVGSEEPASHSQPAAHSLPPPDSTLALLSLNLF